MRQDDFIAFLHELLEPLGKVTARAMFGGWGVYLDGTIIGIVAEGSFFLKADALTEPRFAAAGSAPFMYASPKGPMPMSYWSVPDDAMDSSEAMAPWARLAREAAGRKATVKKSRSASGTDEAKPKPKSLHGDGSAKKPKPALARPMRNKHG